MSDADPIDLVDDLFDEPCTNCGARLRSPELTKCPQCGFRVASVRAASNGAGEIAAAAGHTHHAEHGVEPDAEARDVRDQVDPEFGGEVESDAAALAAAAAAAKAAAKASSPQPSPPTAPKPVGLPDTTIADESTADDHPKSATASKGKTKTEPAAGARTGHPGGTRIALALAIICAVVLSAAHFAGMSGLFPRQGGLFLDAQGQYTLESVRWSDRAVDLVRLLVQRTVVWAAALGALWGLALMRRAPVPDWPAAAARMAAIALATALVTAIELPNRPLEISLEVLLQAALFVGLVVLWFRVSFVEAAQLLGMAALGFIVVHLGAMLVVWATGTAIL